MIDCPMTSPGRCVNSCALKINNECAFVIIAKALKKMSEKGEKEDEE